MIRAVGDRTVASTRHRVLAHLDALRAAGFEVELRTQRAPDRGWWRRPARLRELVTDALVRPPADLLMIHRTTYPPPFARRLAASGVPVVFDFDDAIYLPPPSASQDPATRRRYRRNFDATVQAMDVVICGNSELSGHVAAVRHEVVPTPVDEQRFHPQAIRPATRPVVGWVGHSDNLPFLERLAEPLKELTRRHSGFALRVVADRPPVIDEVPVEFEPWSLETEVSCFDGMAVGLMPLDDSPWTRAKCSFKLLQYMALGIPAVASPVGMNREVMEDGVNALVASSSSDWFDAIDRLLSDRELAARIARAGRDTVEQRYSLAVLSPKLVGVLAECLGASTDHGAHSGASG
jgi:glycosyltransferase involved in cell wall biosynthesis